MGIDKLIIMFALGGLIAFLAHHYKQKTMRYWFATLAGTIVFAGSFCKASKEFGWDYSNAEILKGFFPGFIIVTVLLHLHDIRKPKKIFLACPMASLNNKDYKTLQARLALIVPEIEKTRRIKIFWAARNIATKSAFEGHTEAFKMNFNEFKDSFLFVMIYPEKSPPALFLKPVMRMPRAFRQDIL